MRCRGRFGGALPGSLKALEMGRRWISGLASVPTGENRGIYWRMRVASSARAEGMGGEIKKEMGKGCVEESCNQNGSQVWSGSIGT